MNVKKQNDKALHRTFYFGCKLSIIILVNLNNKGRPHIFTQVVIFPSALYYFWQVHVSVWHQFLSEKFP